MSAGSRTAASLVTSLMLRVWRWRPAWTRHSWMAVSACCIAAYDLHGSFAEGSLSIAAFGEIPQAIKMAWTTPADVDRAVSVILQAKFAAGLCEFTGNQ